MNDDVRFGLGSLSAQPEIARLIGEFIARWSLAEMTLMMPLLVALDSQNQEVAAAILSATNSTEGKVKLVKAAVENMPRHHERQASMKKSLTILENICPDRNSISHHVWAVDLNNDKSFTLDYRKKAGDSARFVNRSEQSL